MKATAPSYFSLLGIGAEAKQLPLERPAPRKVKDVGKAKGPIHTTAPKANRAMPEAHLNKSVLQQHSGLTRAYSNKPPNSSIDQHGSI